MCASIKGFIVNTLGQTFMTHMNLIDVSSDGTKKGINKKTDAECRVFIKP